MTWVHSQTPLPATSFTRQAEICAHDCLHAPTTQHPCRPNSSLNGPWVLGGKLVKVPVDITPLGVLESTWIDTLISMQPSYKLCCIQFDTSLTITLHEQMLRDSHDHVSN